MQLTKIIAVLTLAASIFITGCTNDVSNNIVSELPEPEVAKVEAKNALREWQTLLETGQNAEFIQASMPIKVYEMAVDENGELKPQVVKKLRAFAPKVVNALNEAQFLDPVIRGENVVFVYNDIHSSGGFFKNEEILLTKSGGHWYFNGEMINEVSQ